MRATSGHTTRAWQLAILLALVPAVAAAQAPGVAVAPAESSSTIIDTMIDPSLRSPLAVPTVEWAAEVMGEAKRVSGKLGFVLRPGWTGEVGFTGAVDRDFVSGRSTSLRRLTNGSSAWGATTWTLAGSARATPLLAARVEAGRDAFDYYDLALDRHRDAHASYAVTATAGLILPRDFVVAATYRWSEAWQIADGESCHAAVETGTTACPADRLFRRPAAERWQQFEVQAQLHLGDKVGAQVFLTRDGRYHAWGVEAPVYFMARREGGFTGGLVLSYNGATGRGDVSAFVGQVFRLSK